MPLNLPDRLSHMQDALDLDLSSDPEASFVNVGQRKRHVRQQVVFRSAAEPELYPMDLGSMLPENSQAKRIRSTLETLELPDLQALYKDCGGIPYDAKSFLGVMLLAYLLGIRSSARIEEHCLFDIRFMYVGKGIQPDERTIRRFRRRLDSSVEALFDEVVIACAEAGLVKKRLIAVDGTKIASVASQHQRWFSESEESEVNAMGLLVPDTTDPDCRNMKSQAGFVRGYNCQAAVDCDSGVVVATDVTQCSNDRASLAPMAAKIIANLGGPPEMIVADTGYDSSEGLKACEDLGVDVIVAIEGQSPMFWTVTPENEILCPLGQPATFVSEKFEKGKLIQLLRVQGCVSCEYFGSCCTTRCGRSLRIAAGCDPASRLLAAYRARGPEGKIAMTERMANIERVFADIKWNKKMTRFLLKKLSGAKTEWSLIHMARNILLLSMAILAILPTFLATIAQQLCQFWRMVQSTMNTNPVLQVL